MLKRTRSFCPGFCLCILLIIAFLQGPTPSFASLEIVIQVSPATLNIQSAGQVVTVHTSIAYGQVVGGTVTLNDIPISWWKADNQGNFVAKFLMSEVKALAADDLLVVPGENTLTLSGMTTDETPAEFWGTETITVIDVVPSGSGGK